MKDLKGMWKPPMEMTFTKVMIQYKNFTAFYNAIHAPQIQRNSLFSGRLKRVLY